MNAKTDGDCIINAQSDSYEGLHCLSVHRLEIIVVNNRGIKHGFPFINIRKVPREVLKTEGEARGYFTFPRDLANVNE